MCVSVHFRSLPLDNYLGRLQRRNQNVVYGLTGYKKHLRGNRVFLVTMEETLPESTPDLQRQGDFKYTSLV